MLEGSEPVVSIPWPWLAGGIVTIIGALAAAIRLLFKLVIDRHNAEIKSRDDRRSEDSATWKAAIESVVSSNERAVTTLSASYRESMANLGGQIGEAVARQIKESTEQQADLIRQISKPQPRTVRKK